MKTAIVTGASSGIGLSLSEKLVQAGYSVYGLARNYKKTGFDHQHFNKVICDITNVKALEKHVKQITEKADSVDILVNNAGIGFFGPHEQIKPLQLEQMVATNLTAPLVLTGLLLRDLKKSSGCIINVSSVTATRVSTHGCAYAATKAGLSHFGDSLFEEIRKTGVRVLTIQPDITSTGFYDSLDFTYSTDEGAFIVPETVADAIMDFINMPAGTVVTGLTIRPQLNRIKRKSPGVPEP